MPKMASLLSQQLDAAAPEERVRVIVRYGTATPPIALRGALSSKVTTFHLLPLVALEMPAAGVQALAASDDVVTIWPDLPVHVWLDQSVPMIGTGIVWAAGLRGKDIAVAVIDTGVDLGHPDLAGRVAKSKDLTGQGFQDNHGHGTHVAGIIAGNGAASGGRYTGVAPEATIMAAKVLRGDGSGNTSDVMAGVEWAVDQGAHVINLSLGSDATSDGSDALSQMCDAAADQGVVVCVAAGNAGPGSRTIGAPGAARKVITVAATDRADGIAGFSSRGPTADGRPKPDICFPGVAIASCRAQGTGMGQIIDDYYTAASGTSMATPHCAGAAALLLQADRQRTPQAIKDLLMDSAKDLLIDIYAQGRGRAQVDKAFRGEVTPQPPPPQQGQGCRSVLRNLGAALHSRQ